MGDQLKDEYGDFGLDVYPGIVDNLTGKIKGKDPKGGSTVLPQKVNN